MLDTERLAIGHALGLNLQNLLDVVKNCYGVQYDSIYHFARESPPHNSMKVAPSDLQSRYIIEDVPYALVPWYHLAKNHSLEVPTIELAINLASLATGNDYFITGRRV